MLTFDDGWRNALNAVPILRALGFKAGILIITDKGIRDVTHPWDLHENLVTWIDGKVPGKGSADVFYELRKSKHTLERELGSKISYLARPCGGYHDAMIKMAKAQGYEALLTIEPGFNKVGDNLKEIRRIQVDGARDLEIFEQMLKKGRPAICGPGRRNTTPHSPSPDQLII